MGMCTLVAINEKGAEYIKRLGLIPRNLTQPGMDAYNRVLLNEGVQYVAGRSDAKKLGSIVPTTKARS